MDFYKYEKEICGANEESLESCIRVDKITCSCSAKYPVYTNYLFCPECGASLKEILVPIWRELVHIKNAEDAYIEQRIREIMKMFETALFAEHGLKWNDVVKIPVVSLYNYCWHLRCKNESAFATVQRNFDKIIEASL